MKKLLLLILIFYQTIVINSCLSTHSNSEDKINNSRNTFQVDSFSIPANSELLESTEFKNDGITYLIEQRYRLPSGEILYAYYDVEGSNSVTIQKIEQAPLLTIGTDVNIPGLPGYREFDFDNDKRKLVQFMKLFKLGERDGGKVRTPSIADSLFNHSEQYTTYKLVLDLFDETWVLERRDWYNKRRTDLSRIYTTKIFRVEQYNN